MGFLSGIGGSLGGVGLGAAIVEVGVDTTGLTTGLAKAKAEVQSSSNAMGAATKAISTGFIIAGAAAVLAIGKAVNSTVEWASQVRQLQRVTGQSAEQASGLLGAAGELGIGVDQLARSFGLLEKNIVNAAPNLEKYGIATRDASGAIKPFDDVLGAVITKFNELPAGPEQAAFAMNVFGRSGKDLIPILQRGTEGLAELEAKAKDMGLVMSQDDVDAAKALTLAQNALHESVKGLQIAIGTALLPVITSAVEIFTSLVEAIAKIPGPVLDMILLMTALTGGVLLVQKAIALLNAAFGPLIAGLFGAGEAASGLGAEMAAAAGPIGLAVAAMTLAYLASAHLSGALTPIIEKMDNAAAAAQLAASAHIPFAEALDRVENATEAGTDALVDYKAAQDALVPGILGITTGMSQLAEDQRTVNNLRKRGKQDTQAYADAEIAVLNDQASLNDGIKEYISNLNKAGSSNKQVTADLTRLGHQAGLSAGEIRQLIAGALDLASSTDNAAGKVRLLGSALNGLPKVTDVTVHTHYIQSHER